jgi:hypothetical protein
MVVVDGILMPQVGDDMSNAIWTCRCGARYRVSPAQTEKKLRCKKCGYSEQIAAKGPLPLAGDEPSSTAPIQFPADHDVIIEESEPPHPSPANRRTFGADVASSLVLPIEPQNLPAFAICTFFNLLALGLVHSVTQVVMWGNISILNFVLSIVGVAAFAWLFAYYMRIIAEVADDDDDLPTTMTGSVYDVILKPFFTFLTTWFCLLLPAIALVYLGLYCDMYVPRLWFQATLVFAVAMWPMAILCVSIGGIGIFTRADLILYTVFSTFLPYTIVWLLLLLTGACGYGLFRLLASEVAGRTPLLSRHFLAGLALLAMATTFLSIVAMRVIGLYYRHFKHRFAWSWE